MRLTPHEILMYLGVHVPEDGIEINPYDTYLHATLLRLLGKQMSVSAIDDSDLTDLRVGMHGAVNGPGSVVSEPTGESLEKLRMTLRVIQKQLGMTVT